MDFLSKNLRFLRKRLSITQEEMAMMLDLKKSTYASYENEEGNTPPVKILLALARRFEVSLENLLELDYTTLGGQDTLRLSDREIYFPVSVDLQGTELVDVVPASYRAQAGYLRDFSDPAYIRQLPKVNWDMGTHEPGTKRIFQITGDSMWPIPSLSYVLGVRKNYEDLIPGHAYVIVTQHDILFKRIRKEKDHLLLLSDNPVYPPQQIPADEVQQYWKVLKVIIDMPSDAPANYDVREAIQDTRQKVNMVLDRLENLERPGSRA